MDCSTMENSASNIPCSLNFDPYSSYNPNLLISKLSPQINPLNIYGNMEDELAYLIPKVGAKNNSHHFHINMDVGLYAPEDLSVKIVNDHLLVEGKNNELQAQRNGSLSRKFMRRYELPKGCNPSEIVSKLSAYGVLTVLIPKPTDHSEARNVNIQIEGPNEIFLKKQNQSEVIDNDKNGEEEVERKHN